MPGNPTGLYDYVAIAYTQQGWGGSNFTCAFTYWRTAGGGALFVDTKLANPDYPDLDAGVPDIDISPNTNSGTVGHYGAIAFVQQVDEPWLYEVFVCSSLTGGSFYQVQDPSNNFETIFPLIGLNWGATSTAHYASITMLESINNEPDGTPDGGYNPYGTVFKLDDGTQVNSNWAQISTTVTDLWDPANDLIISDPGPRTAIVTYPNGIQNNFFAGYCDSVDATGSNVYATWGNAADY